MLDQTVNTPSPVGRALPAPPTWMQSLPNHSLITGTLILHVLLGPILTVSPVLVGAHSAATILYGLYLAGFSPRIERAIYVCAYITGAEVLWRMTKTPLFWEMSKYSVIAILLVAMLRHGMLQMRALPLLFFALLLPSAVLPTINVGTADLRNQISFNLSGPLALAVCVWFFSQIRLTVPQLQRIFLAVICPLLSTAAIALMGTLTLSRINFNNSSNYATSGGYGPTQVSSVLGFGALLIFLWLFQGRQQRMQKFMLLGVMTLFIVQSALTFSRGGLYAAVGSALLATYFLVRDKRARMQLIGGAVALFLVANFIILPQLDNFTSGALSKRFTNTSTTGRDSIAKGELQVFYDHPLFGVGPGEARNYRSDHRSAVAHTEFSRLLAEHGLFGLTALLLLLTMSWRHLRQAQSRLAKAVVIALTFWSFLFMASLAMRIVMAAFAFGLTAAMLLIEDPPAKRENELSAIPRWHRL
ncbi:MAG TPA: O-antigen ligase family protein [Blastocatellia bacterium]|nr:O-antigen ligase family protein [Blastocatellia bacterium]HMY73060.1 O-antigen ligase family protein [Blastocatellia bacterium]HNG28576.1 O-antigen ligase family protein [Blastocatellia bacterium]